MDTALSEALVFKLFRAEAATGTVTPPAIVITPNIIKHRRSHYFSAGKMLSVDTFHRQRVKEAFRARIIIAVVPGTHAALRIMPLQHRLIFR